MKKLISCLFLLLWVSVDVSAACRSPAQVRKFRSTHPCPATGKLTGACKGWDVDHICSLFEGGIDDPKNMQWQDMKKPSFWEKEHGACGENTLCGKKKYCNSSNSTPTRQVFNCK